MYEKISEDKILYVKTIVSEWKLNTELVSKAFKDRYASVLNTSNENSVWSYFFNFNFNEKVLSCFSEDYLKLINNEPSWKLALSNSGEFLAVLQDKVLEVHSSENNYSDVIAHWQLPHKDLFPQWRRLVWSPDDSLLFMSDSFGVVYVYESCGGLLACIPPGKMPYDLAQGMCSLVVRELRSFKQGGADDDEDGGNWVFELLCFSFSGELAVYAVSLEGGVRMMHTFDFTNFYPSGITTATYLPTSGFIIIGGKSIFLDGGVNLADIDQESGDRDTLKGRDGDGSGGDDDERSAKYYGLSLWRPLSGHPYYKMVGSEFSVEDASALSLNQSLNYLWSWWQGAKLGDQVYKMLVSPSKQQLLTLHTSHCICLWRLPSMKLLQKHALAAVTEAAAETSDMSKKSRVVDVEWWSDDAIVLLQSTGEVVVGRVASLESLFSSAEAFHACGRVLRIQSGSFCVLECEKNEGKRSLQQINDDNTDEKTPGQADIQADALSNIDDLNDALMSSESLMYSDGDDDDGAQGGGDDDGDGGGRQWKGGMGRLLKKLLNFVTDAESFQLPKKTRFQHLVYRMYNIKHTTPEQLYEAKLDNEEFEEALLLAEQYDLDTDLAYQRQWKRSPVTLETIDKYLAKVKDTRWSLHESVARVPTTLETQQRLLAFGLSSTSLQALWRLRDGGDSSDDGYGGGSSSSGGGGGSSVGGAGSSGGAGVEQELIDQIDFDNLNLHQKEMASLRHKLLTYSDRLCTYEATLPSTGDFSSDTFLSTRSLNLVELALHYARASDHTGLEKVLVHHGDDVIPHWLAILSNLPETTSPRQYRHLLPALDADGSLKAWRSGKWRLEKDWVERCCSFLTKTSADDIGDFLYSEDASLLPFRDGLREADRLTEWYKHRCMQIEACTGRVDYALIIINIAIENNVKNLEGLRDSLTTMEKLVYQCHVSSSLSIHLFSSMDHLQIMHLMLPKPKRDTVVEEVRRWIVPYLQDKEDAEELLKRYLLSLSQLDLVFLEMIVRQSALQKDDAIIKDATVLRQVAEMCLYAHQGCEQLGTMQYIVSHLPDDEGSEILCKNGINTSLSRVKEIQESEKEVLQLFTMLARSHVRKQPPKDVEGLKELLTDMLLLRGEVFVSLDQLTCYQLFVSSLLSSGRLEYIQLAGDILHSPLPPSSSTTHISSTHFTTTATTTTTVLNNHRLKLLTSAASGLKDSLKSYSPFNKPPALFPRTSFGQTAAPSSDFEQPLIDHRVAEKLLLDAAVGYFDSSSCVADQDMKLARVCLDLVQGKSEAVQDELSLIEGVAMLESLGLNLLPVQVRMAERKVELVKKVLQNKRMVYKNFNKLFELGRLLNTHKNIGEDDDVVRGRLLVLCLEAALNERDFFSCSDLARKLVALEFGEAWSVCQRVASHQDFKNADDKLLLLRFCLVHASDDQLEALITCLSHLHSQSLQKQVEMSQAPKQSSPPPPLPTTTPHPSPPPPPSSSPTLPHHHQQTPPPSNHSQQQLILDQTKVVISRTNRVVKGVLSSFRDTSWWAGVVTTATDQLKTLTDFQGARRQRRTVLYKPMDERHACVVVHPFYEAVYRDQALKPLLHLPSGDYSDLSLASSPSPPPPSIFTLIIHNLDPQVTTEDLTQVLMELCQSSLPQDTTMALLCLLSLPRSASAEAFFDQSKDALFTHQLALLFYSILIANWLIGNEKRFTNETSLQNPRLLIKDVTHFVDKMEVDWSGGCLKVVKLFQEHRLWLRNHLNKQRVSASQAKKKAEESEIISLPQDATTSVQQLDELATTTIATIKTTTTTATATTTTTSTATAITATATTTTAATATTATATTTTATNLPTKKVVDEVKKQKAKTKTRMPEEMKDSETPQTSEVPHKDTSKVASEPLEPAVESIHLTTASTDASDITSPSVSHKATSNDSPQLFSFEKVASDLYTMPAPHATALSALQFVPPGTLLTNSEGFEDSSTPKQAPTTAASSVPDESTTTTTAADAGLSLLLLPDASLQASLSMHEAPSQRESLREPLIVLVSAVSSVADAALNDETSLNPATTVDQEKSSIDFSSSQKEQTSSTISSIPVPSPSLPPSSLQPTVEAPHPSEPVSNESTKPSEEALEKAFSGSHKTASTPQQPLEDTSSAAVIEGLLSSGQSMQAGDLYMRWKGTHQAFRNLNAAFAFAEKFRKSGK